jgi:hypothetical protein
MKKLSMILLAAPFLMMGCEKNVQIEIPVKAPSLVLNAWLEKNQVFQITVGKSQSILAPRNTSGQWGENYVVKNAVPVIYENDIPIDTLVYQPTDFTYTSSHNKNVRAGFSYTVKVNAPGFTQVEAKTAVPSQSAIASVSRAKNARTNSNNVTYDEVTIKLNDPAETNFYLVQFFGASYGGGGTQPIYCVSTNDKDVEPIGDNADPLATDNCYDGGRLLLKDVNFNGAQKIVRFFVESMQLADYVEPTGKINRPYVKVMRVTEDYFRFLKSYSNYYSSNDNPFAEPVNVYGNVKNGYGIFSAYTMAVDSIR